MRLDEALGDDQIGLPHQPVQPQFAAGGQGAEEGHVFHFLRLVNDEGLVVHNLIAIFGAQLGFCGGAMHAGGHQQGDMRIRIAFADFAQQQWHGHGAGPGACVIAGDDHDALLPPGKLAHPRRSERVFQRLTHQLLLRLHTGMPLLLMGGRQTGAQPIFAYFQLLRALAIGNINDHRLCPLALLLRKKPVRYAGLSVTSYRMAEPAFIISWESSAAS